MPRFSPTVLKFCAAAAILLATSSLAQAAPASIHVQGAGATPSGQVSLTLPGLPQPVGAKVGEDGTFTFPPFPYDYSGPLPLKFSVPVSGSRKEALKANAFTLTIDPLAFAVTAEGYASKASSIALNLSGNATAGIANKNAYFLVSTPPDAEVLNAEKPARITASIINVKESCCPRTMVPTEPLTIVIESRPSLPPPGDIVAVPPPVVGAIAPAAAPAAAQTPSAEPAAPDTPAPKKPNKPLKPGTGVSPQYPQGRPDPKAQKQSEADDQSGALSVGEVEHIVQLEAEPLAYATWSSSISWAQGLASVNDHVVHAILLQARMIGGFIDAQNFLDAQRSIQRRTSRAINNFTPSEALCRFGTLSRSLSATEERGRKTQLQLSKVLSDRERMHAGTIYADSQGSGSYARTRDFIVTYCDKSDENTALETVCEAESDTKFNRDVDYTRTIDAPLTLPVNFLTPPSDPQKAENGFVIELLNNLIANEPASDMSYESVSAGKALTDDVQNFRTAVAARNVARNSFSALIGMKAEGTAASGTYMRQVLQSMGLSADDATRLIGTNPSYYAQMEVLTKKIYQDPAFFINLYDKPANVDRQRTAIRALGLQQQNDLLQTLKRREMLLSVLLELKLRNTQDK